MSTKLQDGRRLAAKVAVVVALAAGTMVGVTHTAHADGICDADTSSCVVVPTVPALGCKVGMGSAYVGSTPPEFNWTGPTAQCG